MSNDYNADKLDVYESTEPKVALGDELSTRSKSKSAHLDDPLDASYVPPPGKFHLKSENVSTIIYCIADGFRITHSGSLTGWLMQSH